MRRQLLLIVEVCSLFLVAQAAQPVVILDNASVVGNDLGSTFQFLGLPYVLPPVDGLRFQKPQPIPPYSGSISATQLGHSCPQQPIEVPVISGLPQEIIDIIVNLYISLTNPQSEDCLTINVYTPSTATRSSRFPVAVYFHGGGFAVGGSSQVDGSALVSQSGNKIIVVTLNYRLAGLGFLGGKEIRDAGVGNLGLLDQREALRWVRKYIPAFGGDPDKVTFWGDSAGAMSVALHMIANNGDHENLFRAGIMQSGSILSVGDITLGQGHYDQIVADAGCSGSTDTLACLRTIPFSTLKPAMDKVPSFFDYRVTHLAWLPRADGTFLTDHPQRLVEQGIIARVPFITGNCDDEGTLFSLPPLNVSNDAQFRQYMQEIYMQGINEDQLNQLALAYPDDVEQGSPFDTGVLNALSPQYKRISAFQGDIIFHAPRRWFLQHTSGKQAIWVYQSKRLKTFTIIGSYHDSVLIPNVLGSDLFQYLYRFVVNLDPNDNSITGIFSYKWPQYTTGNPNQMVLNEGIPPLNLPTTTGKDTFRSDSMSLLTNLTFTLPI